jgi:hypothetical protein
MVRGTQIKKETFGDTTETTYDYDPNRHWLTGITTTRPNPSSQPTTIQALSFIPYPNGQNASPA